MEIVYCRLIRSFIVFECLIRSLYSLGVLRLVTFYSLCLLFCHCENVKSILDHWIATWNIGIGLSVVCLRGEGVGNTGVSERASASFSKFRCHNVWVTKC